MKSLQAALVGFAYFLVVLTASAIPGIAAADTVQIQYALNDLGPAPQGELFEYLYVVSGNFAPNSGFDVLFPLASGYQSGDLISTGDLSSLDFTPLLLQPDPQIPDGGHLTAIWLGNSPLELSQPTLEASATILWRGPGSPGAQPFKVFTSDAELDSFTTIQTGTTQDINAPVVPLPASWLTLGSALTLLGLFSRTRPRLVGLAAQMGH